MKLNTDIRINGVMYEKGVDVKGYMIYPFFLFHMLAFGLSGFFLAYGEKADVAFLYMHGGIAITVYMVFYLVIFGRGKVLWMLINAVLGLFGIYAQISWILGLFDKNIDDYPWYIHVIPFLYYVLYTFLLHNAVHDLFHTGDDVTKKNRVDWVYVVLSLLVYGGIRWFTR